ncbi:SMI1/KNR4 family protein [Streptomyces sp. NBC_01506]|uniref:SMI1/KNR4 family protein n=1 Tax=Streptomyces sp. NBC_01506 TaxID=2903887 RepID=UPI00386E2F3E
MDDLSRAWERIEAWLRGHQCTSALSELPPASSEEAVQVLQDAIPYPLHPHLVQWLRIHGGAPMNDAPMNDAPVWPGGHVPYDVEALKRGPDYMREMLEEFHDEFGEDPEEWVMSPWADPLWLPVAGTHTGESLLVDHRPGDTYGNIIEIDYESNEVTAVRWKSLGEMIRLMAQSLETGTPVPYSHRYSRVPQLNEGPPSHLTWVLRETLADETEREQVTPEDQLVTAAWERLKVWLRLRAPESYASLRPGASDHRIGQVEQRLGFPLPAPLRALWTLNDGVTASGAGAFLNGLALMPIETALETREFVADEIPGWGSRWVPFTADTVDEPTTGDFMDCDTGLTGTWAKGEEPRMHHTPEGGLTLPGALAHIVEVAMAGTDLRVPSMSGGGALGVAVGLLMVEEPREGAGGAGAPSPGRHPAVDRREAVGSEQITAHQIP